MNIKLLKYTSFSLLDVVQQLLHSHTHTHIYIYTLPALMNIYNFFFFLCFDVEIPGSFSPASSLCFPSSYSFVAFIFYTTDYNNDSDDFFSPSSPLSFVLDSKKKKQQP